MSPKKSPMRIVFSRVIGILVFVVLLIFANFLYPYLPSRFFMELVLFFNTNIEIIVVMSILFLLGELFELFNYPFNLPGPLFTAFASLLLISFVFGIFSALDSQLNINLYDFFQWLAVIIYPAVFGTVTLIGYIGLFARALRRETEEVILDLTPSGWQELGWEFKQLFIDGFNWIKGLFGYSKDEQDKPGNDKPKE